MLTKATVKLVQSLGDKRSRKEHGLFVAEGPKTVSELPASKIKVKTLFATESWTLVNPGMLTNTEIVLVSEKELKQLSHLVTPNEVVALCEIPDVMMNEQDIRAGFTLALDTIQDPGNLGTIIRIADWYGIRNILCSPGCADVYGPKVLNASMGSFLRVSVFEVDLVEFFSGNPDLPVFGALLEGQSLYRVEFPDAGVLLVGNEGSGVSESLRRFISLPVFIPRRGAAESLNAAVAAGVICDAWARGRT